jgi:hypothetical protein
MPRAENDAARLGRGITNGSVLGPGNPPAAEHDIATIEDRGLAGRGRPDRINGLDFPAT